MHIIDMKKEAQEIVHKSDPYLALILSPSLTKNQQTNYFH